MATLEKIRSKGGVLVAIFVGFALFAFIMTDLMSSGGSMFTGSRMEVANINGNSINIQDFQNKVSEMEEFNKLNQGNNSLSEEQVNRLRDQVWDQLISQTILSEKYQELGLSVSSDELKDMVSGNHIHPAILQHPLFANQQTGQFDKQQVINFLMAKNQDPTAHFYWMVMEEQLINDQLFNKYRDLLKKGMYVPTDWKESEIEARSKQVDFDFVTTRFTSVSDSLVSVSDKEITAYYKKNRDQFQQEASRSLEYISFAVEPTEEDRENTLKWVTNMMKDFSKPEIDAVQFVNLNSDEPFSNRNHRAAEFSSEIESFVTTATLGEVYGPYLEDNAYKATRLVAIQQLPDSVRARHILLQGTSLEEANKKADSLMNLINKGADFASLARKYSQDQGSAINGGDLDWFTEGTMVKPFNDAAFKGRKGDLVKVESDFGVHIIQIQDQSKLSPKYQIATLARNITYSSKTYQRVYSEATRFASLNNSVEKFNEAITEENKTKRFARNVHRNDRTINNLDGSRELVKWSYEASVGALSPVFEFSDQFVIAHLISATEKGTTPLADVKSIIERNLLNDKKADYIIAKYNQAIGEGESLETIASSMNGNVQSANDITFSSFQVPGAGVEPSLVALALYSPINEISKPIRGMNGVYIVKVNNIDEIDIEPENVEAELAQGATMKIDYQLMEVLTKRSEIEDKRYNFY